MGLLRGFQNLATTSSQTNSHTQFYFPIILFQLQKICSSVQFLSIEYLTILRWYYWTKMGSSLQYIISSNMAIKSYKNTYNPSQRTMLPFKTHIWQWQKKTKLITWALFTEYQNTTLNILATIRTNPNQTPIKRTCSFIFFQIW